MLLLGAMPEWPDDESSCAPAGCNAWPDDEGSCAWTDDEILLGAMMGVAIHSR